MAGSEESVKTAAATLRANGQEQTAVMFETVMLPFLHRLDVAFKEDLNATEFRAAVITLVANILMVTANNVGRGEDNGVQFLNDVVFDVTQTLQAMVESYEQNQTETTRAN
jgi:hypothetical protein